MCSEGQVPTLVVGKGFPGEGLGVSHSCSPGLLVAMGPRAIGDSGGGMGGSPVGSRSGTVPGLDHACNCISKHIFLFFNSHAWKCNFAALKYNVPSLSSISLL